MSTNSMGKTASCARRWHRMSLRTLMALTAVISIALAWIAKQRQTEVVRNNAILELEGVGVMIDFEKRWRSSWRAFFLGADARGDAVAADYTIRIPDGRFHKLCELPITGLYIEATDLSDQDFESIGQMANLTKLEVLQSPYLHFSDNGVRHLTRLTNLQKLMLCHSGLTDAALPFVASIRSLEVLNLTTARVTDDGVRHLENLPRLREFYLSQTPVSGDCLRNVRNIHSLSGLYLDYTSIADEHLNLLNGLPNLGRLSLCYSPVSDVGVEVLAHSKSISALALAGTRVTSAGLVHAINSGRLERLVIDEGQRTDDVVLAAEMHHVELSIAYDVLKQRQTR